MDFLFRIAILALGYLYPAYKCFKLIESGKPKSDQLHVWCQYWIIIAVFTGSERVADTFISWLPFYSGAKLAFVVYLWHPDTKGTEYIYQTFLKPLVSKHAECVDLDLGLLRDEAVRVLIIFWTRLMLHVQSKVSGMLHQTNAVESLNPVSRPALQDGVPAYPPSVPVSVYWRNLQQQRERWPPTYSGHQPLVSQSAIWPDEEHKKRACILQNASTLQSLIVLPAGQRKQSTQLNHRTSASHPASQSQQDLGALRTASGPSAPTGDPKDNGLDKEETDFELVHHPNEMPIAAHKNISAQRERLRWWW